MRNKKILIIDDHPLVVRGIIETIRNTNGFEVCGTISSTDEPVAKVEALNPDIIILDINFADKISGSVYLKLIKEKIPSVKVLILTVFESPILLKQTFNLGASGFLTKLDNAEMIIKALQVVDEGKQFISPRVEALFQDFNDIPVLSRREEQVLGLITKGVTTKDIAKTLELSPKTVETYKSRISEKLNANTIPAMIRAASEFGLALDD